MITNNGLKRLFYKKRLWSIFNFTTYFDSEEVFWIHFKQERDMIEMSASGHDQHYWIKPVWG